MQFREIPSSCKVQGGSREDVRENTVKALNSSFATRVLIVALDGIYSVAAAGPFRFLSQV